MKSIQISDKLIAQYKPEQHSTLLLNMLVLMKYLSGMTAAQIAEEMNIVKSSLRQRAETAVSVLWRFYYTQEERNVFRQRGEYGTVPFLRNESGRWIAVCEEIITKLTSLNTPLDRETAKTFRYIEIMELFLHGISNYHLSVWYKTQRKTIETIQKRVLYYVIQESPVELKHYFVQQGNDDWLYERVVIHLENKCKGKPSNKNDTISEKWLAEYANYKKRHQYVADNIETLIAKNKGTEAQEKIIAAITLLEENGYRVTKDDS